MRVIVGQFCHETNTFSVQKADTEDFSKLFCYRANEVRAKLAPGGRFYFAEGHPFMLMLEEIDGRLVPTYPQDTPADRPLVALLRDLL